VVWLIRPANHMVSEEKHELLRVQRENRFKAAVGGPDSSAGDGVDMGMEVNCIHNREQ
jgi:hypothetical protein